MQRQIFTDCNFLSWDLDLSSPKSSDHISFQRKGTAVHLYLLRNKVEWIHAFCVGKPQEGDRFLWGSPREELLLVIPSEGEDSYLPSHQQTRLEVSASLSAAIWKRTGPSLCVPAATTLKGLPTPKSKRIFLAEINCSLASMLECHLDRNSLLETNRKGTFRHLLPNTLKILMKTQHQSSETSPNNNNFRSPHEVL